MPERELFGATPDKPEQSSAAGIDRSGRHLERRLDALPDDHPSSARYGLADQRRPLGERGRAELPGSGWETDSVRTSVDRPTLADIHLPGDRGRHVLDDDGPGKPGGGHRHGANRPGKTEFPESWSDEVIISAIEDVSRSPDDVRWQSNGRWHVSGEREGVKVHAVVQPDGAIWTAWPEPGGPGVRKNP
jgi:hypothetical protein